MPDKAAAQIADRSCFPLVDSLSLPATSRMLTNQKSHLSNGKDRETQVSAKIEDRIEDIINVMIMIRLAIGSTAKINPSST